MPGQPVASNFTTQASNATLGHAEAKVAPTAAQLQQIVAFQNALFTAQASDTAAGPLDAAGATGGPVPLASQPFYIGINDSLAPDPTGQPSSLVAFTLYRQWGDARHTAAQQAVARGETLFNTFAFDIAAVGGLNDVLGQPTIRGTCSTCETPRCKRWRASCCRPRNTVK